MNPIYIKGDLLPDGRPTLPVAPGVVPLWGRGWRRPDGRIETLVMTVNGPRRLSWLKKHRAWLDTTDRMQLESGLLKALDAVKSK